jgi:hypothetical protein
MRISDICGRSSQDSAKSPGQLLVNGLPAFTQHPLSEVPRGFNKARFVHQRPALEAAWWSGCVSSRRFPGWAHRM